MDRVLVNSQNKAYSINGHLLKHESMTLVRYWDGTDAPVSGKWYDKIANQYWTLTKATHTDGYYQFLNATASSAATSYGILNGTLPDLGYHWKIVMDVEIQIKSGTAAYVPVDFCSITGTEANSCAVGVYLNPNKNWVINAKLNGNDSVSTYRPEDLQESNIGTVDEWIRKRIEFGVRSSSIANKDEMYLKIDNATAVTPTPFTPIKMDRWSIRGSYLARSVIASSTTYPYSTSVRIHDIKVYVASNYDSEIEYLQINGAQAINTQIYPTTLDLDIRCGSANGFRFGWDRQNVAAGTWIHMSQTSFTYKDWSTRTMLSEITDTETTSIWRYDMQSGLYKDGALIKSFTASLGNNDISSIPLYIGNSFDVTANALDPVTSELNIKIKWIQVYRAGTLILDLIPVRLGFTGYMYDKLSGKLFGNVGSGSFILGQDLHQVEYLESTGTQYIVTDIYPDSTYTFDTKIAVTQNENTVFWGTRNEGNTLTENKQCYFNYNRGHVFLYTTSVQGTGNWDCGFTPTVGQMYSFNGITTVSTMIKTLYPMPLFAFNSLGTINTSLGKCRIGRWTAYSNGVKIADFIPVKKNGIGCMYDKVSGKFYENSGTGSFILGPDII